MRAFIKCELSSNASFHRNNLIFPINTVASTDSPSQDLFFEGNARYHFNENVNTLFGGALHYLEGDIGIITPTSKTVSPFDYWRKSFYMQTEFQALDWLKIVAGGQLNRPQESKTEYSPRMAFIANLNPATNEVNPEAKSYTNLTANVEIDLKTAFDLPAAMPEMNFSLYGDNLLNEDIYFPSFNRQNINTLPHHSGRGVYGTFSVKF